MSASNLKKSDRIAIRLAVQTSPYVDYSLAVAIADRESGCKNIVGDSGHGRGMFQLDDRYQQDFLKRHKGCNNGSSFPRYDSALPKGRVPTVYAGCKRMCDIIDGNVKQAKADGVAWGSRLKVAIAAYNAGYSGALKGYHLGKTDLFTTGENYSADVLKRRL